jgi:hypothetical protein
MTYRVNREGLLLIQTTEMGMPTVMKTSMLPWIWKEVAKMECCELLWREVIIWTFQHCLINTNEPFKNIFKKQNLNIFWK